MGLSEKDDKKALIEWYEHHSDMSSNITFRGSEDHYASFIEQFKADLPECRDRLSELICSSLATIEVPVELKLYVARHCPHCPGVIRTLIPVAVECKNIHLKIIDGAIHTEEAAQDKIMSVPCLILDNNFRWTGALNLEEVVEMILNRDLSALGTSSLKMILEEGKAGWIARQMLDYHNIFPGFIALINHETWSVRLGAMVVLEEVAEEDPDLAVTIAPSLLKSFSKADIPTQGDILYALGVAGDHSVKEQLLALIEQISHPEVLEAAHEAVEAIESKFEATLTPHQGSS